MRTIYLHRGRSCRLWVCVGALVAAQYCRLAVIALREEGEKP